jgi:hypothetical protein
MRVLSIMMIDRDVANQMPDDHEMERMSGLLAEIRAAGALVDTGGKMAEHFEVAVARQGGKTTITDGPFTEAKEVVGGYALFEVKDKAEAVAWTERFLDVIGDATCYLHEVSCA